MHAQPNPLQELTNCFKYVAYGNTQGIVTEQVQGLLTRYPVFRPQVEQLEFPGEMRQNFLVLKGPIVATVNSQSHNFPVKIIMPQGFPFHPPRVYLDMTIPVSLLQSKTYLGSQNAFKIPYLTNWTNSHNMRQKPNLTDMMGYLQAVIASDPPMEQGIGAAMMGSYFPPQQAMPQQMNQPYNPYSQYQPQQQQPQLKPQQQYGNAPSTHQQQQQHVPGADYEILAKIDQVASDYQEAAQHALNKMVESNVQMYKNKTLIDEQIEQLKTKCGQCDNNIQVLQVQNQRIQQFISEQAGSQEISEENIDSIIYPNDAFSHKIIDLTAKENAFEDCLMALKKAYEKDQLNTQDFLMNIRRLSNKQFKATLKRNKIIKALSGGIKQHA